MNKIIIPTLLSVCVLVAGIFAFAPVEQASTVHTAILSGTTGLVCVDEESVVLADGAPDNDIITYTFSQPILLTQILVNADSTLNGNALNFDHWEADGVRSSGNPMAVAVTDIVSGQAFGETLIGLEALMVESTLAITVFDASIEQDDEVSITFCGFTANPESFTSADITTEVTPAA